MKVLLWMNRIILETDPVAIASRVSRPRADTAGEIVINEQTILSACEFADLPICFFCLFGKRETRG